MNDLLTKIRIEKADQEYVEWFVCQFFRNLSSVISRHSGNLSELDLRNCGLDAINEGRVSVELNLNTRPFFN